MKPFFTSSGCHNVPLFFFRRHTKPLTIVFPVAVAGKIHRPRQAIDRQRGVYGKFGHKHPGAQIIHKPEGTRSAVRTAPPSCEASGGKTTRRARRLKAWSKFLKYMSMCMTQKIFRGGDN